MHPPKCGLPLEITPSPAMRWYVVPFVYAFTLVAAPPLGAAETEPIRIEYRAVSGVGCPSEADFEAQVLARTRSARPAMDGEAARTFRIELRRTGTRISGSLVIQETDGATMARRVNGTACADVATVLALATALAIDPRAELAPHQTLEDTREPEPLAEPLEPLEPATAVTVDEHARHTWRPRWALGATAAFSVAPQPAFGVSLLGGLHRGAPPLGELGLELVYRHAGSSSVRGARAEFHFYAARPTLCVAAVEFGTSLSAAPCVAMEMGGVTGVGSQIPTSEKRTKFWATGDLVLRLELELGAEWFVMLEGGVAFPMTRYSFVFQNPDTSIYEVPALAATSALRVGTPF